MEEPKEDRTRQQITWAACDALAGQGKKPSIGLVREWCAENGGTRGSDGAVQSDINLWYADLLNMRKRGYLELPPVLAGLFAKVWAQACEEADAKLAKQRADLAVQLAEMENLVDLAQQDTLDAVEIANSLTTKLTIAGNEISVRDELIRRQDEAAAEMRSTMQAKDERIDGLNADINRKTQEHAGSVEELNGIRKHMLMQIDEARNNGREWQAKYERVDLENQTNVATYRQRSSKLEADMANLKGRNTAIEEALLAASNREQSLMDEIARLSSTNREVKVTTQAPKLKPMKKRILPKRKKL